MSMSPVTCLHVQIIQRRIHPYVYLLGHNNPASEDQNHYYEYLRMYAEYIHVSMRYLLICANNTRWMVKIIYIRNILGISAKLETILLCKRVPN